jgi:hypothetical protein
VKAGARVQTDSGAKQKSRNKAKEKVPWYLEAQVITGGTRGVPDQQDLFGVEELPG